MKEKLNLMEKYDVNIQLAENEEVDELGTSDNEEKRKLLKKTKIARQTWSILEIYQKIKGNKLILNPDYQRNDVWDPNKKTAFIESLFMGIIIPPIYVVEIPGKDFLEENKYEVVDGKQRLSTINAFIENRLRLKGKALEYYEDWFAEKVFYEIREQNDELINAMLSSVLDIYVITANSPEFTKYDIFSRLNKGSEPLRVNEIRKAVYQSEMMRAVNEFVDEYVSFDSAKGLVIKEPYSTAFTKKAIQRYEDYGRFFRSIAFCYKADLANGIVAQYNSRPREMINDVLAGFQKGTICFDAAIVRSIITDTLQLVLAFNKSNSKYTDYLIDACICYCAQYRSQVMAAVDKISENKIIMETLTRSPSTTSNVNARLKQVGKIIQGL